MAFLHQVTGRGEAGWPASYDRNFLAGRRNSADGRVVHVFLFVICDKALQISDADRLHLFSHQATTFAMVFLWADSARDCRKNVVLTNLGGSRQIITGHDQLDEFLDLNSHWTILDANGFGAFQTAL